MSPSLLSGSFNLDPMVTGYTSRDKCGHHRPAASPGGSGGGGIRGLSRVDSEGLEAVYLKLADMGPKIVTMLWSAIEEVSNGVLLL